MCAMITGVIQTNFHVYRNVNGSGSVPFLVKWKIREDAPENKLIDSVRRNFYKLSIILEIIPVSYTNMLFSGGSRLERKRCCHNI